jgi:hypothetical protein
VALLNSGVATASAQSLSSKPIRIVVPVAAGAATDTLARVAGDWLGKKTGLPITPLAVSGPDPGDRVCYNVKCPEPFPPDTEVTDQFGAKVFIPEFSEDGGRVITCNAEETEWQVRDTESMIVICRGPFLGKHYGANFADHDRRVEVDERPPLRFPWLYNLMIQVFGRPVVPVWRVVVYDSKTGSRVRSLPIYSIDQFTSDGTGARGRSSIGPSNEVHYELWSLTPPHPRR